MFDFAWSEFALIGVVALVAIGPKDMPVAIKTVAGLVKKARKMAGEFQTHLDDLMKEADLGEMRGHLKDLRSFNLRDQVTRAVDPDGTMRSTFKDNPFHPVPSQPDQPDTVIAAHPHTTVDDVPPGRTILAPLHGFHGPTDHRSPAPASAPAFIPPSVVADEHARQAAPAFIPPAHARLPAHASEPG